MWEHLQDIPADSQDDATDEVNTYLHLKFSKAFTIVPVLSIRFMTFSWINFEIAPHLVISYVLGLIFFRSY